MPETRVSDVIVPDELSDMVTAQISPHIDFQRLGIATKDYGNKDVSESGHFAKVPFYDQLTGDDEVITDTTSLTPGNISTDTDIGVVCHRGKAWASRDLAKILSGDDPQKEIAKQVAKFWGKKMNNTMIQVLNGIFYPSTGALASTHYLKTAADDTAAVIITAASIVRAASKLGDEMSEFDAIVVHSLVYADMVTAKMVSHPTVSTPDSVDITAGPGRFLGLDIIVSDYCPTSGSGTYGLYSCYLLKKGCMYLGMQKSVMTESDRDILAQKDVLASTVHYVPHMKLVKWNSTDTNPTNAALATASKWTNIADDNKFIGAVSLVVNATQN
jgi:hypothetical protein